MFKKTLWRLTVWNAGIFIVLIGLIGLTIYFYTRGVLYYQMDRSLTQSAELMRSGQPPVHDPGMSVVFWDNEKNLIGVNRGIQWDQNLLNDLKPDKLNQIEDRKIQGVYFRFISTKIFTTDGRVIAEFIYINSERPLLNTLLLIIISGMIVGSILAVIAGYFLARRALQPIKNSWEKQQQFVSDASHELRTPLTIIQSRVEHLLQFPQSNIQDKLSDISVTLGESRRLRRLVSHLLTLAGSDADRIEVKQDKILLNDLLKRVIEPFAEMASFEGKTLNVNVPHEPFYILGDEERLHQLLVILLDNAMKYTGDDGKIDVSCTRDNHGITLTVSDNGIGISKENQSKIFDRFFQADASRTHKEGTGLGLSIAQWIIDKHKGKVSVESELHQGTTFQITFPVFKPTKPKDADQSE